jgi:asparagine synthase (glutamine-hydrolysing)
MCGIAGIVSRRPLLPQHVAQVGRLTEALTHRGRDGSGQYDEEHVALGMRRLSIIDPQTGWQPLYNEDRNLVLVANGEIYNFIELRHELRKRHRFATGSDCETILHLYEEHGAQCVDHLRGMFAFALWDKVNHRLLLARDRMGEKPLYLVDDGDTLVFASEMKALLRAGVVDLKLEPDSVALYHHYGYVPEPDTMVRGVRKLPAAHTLVFDVGSGAAQLKRYWCMEDAPPLDGDPSVAIRNELHRVSELVVRSDVPVGVALSGGLDSSVVALLAAARSPRTIHAFTVGYPGRPMQDETEDARLLAEHLRMPFHAITVSTEQMVSDFPAMVFDRDDPIDDKSGSSYHELMKLARREGVPVMMMGQGGDELFWGYDWVRRSVGASKRKQALRADGSVGVFDYVRPSRPPYSYTGCIRWLQSGGGILDGWQRYRADRTSPIDRLVFADLEPRFRMARAGMGGLYSEAFRKQINCERAFELFTRALPWPPLDVLVTRLICRTYLRENGIAQGDRLGMASTVELRLPLVDHRLVETVIGLRKARSDWELPPKQWFREAVKDLVPPFVYGRRKRGFTPPWRAWSRALSEAYGHMLPDGYLVQHGIMDGCQARRLREHLVPRRFGLSDPMAERTLVLEIWCRKMESAAGAGIRDTERSENHKHL